MDIDANVVIDNLLVQIAELSKDNAFLQAQVKALSETKENKKEENGDEE